MAVLMTPAQTAKMERMTHARNTSASLLTYFTPTNTTVAMEVNRMVPYTRMLLSRAASASAPSRPSRGNMAALGTMQICRGKELIYLSLTLCIQGNQQYFYHKKKNPENIIAAQGHLSGTCFGSVTFTPHLLWPVWGFKLAVFRLQTCLSTSLFAAKWKRKMYIYIFFI